MSCGERRNGIVRACLALLAASLALLACAAIGLATSPKAQAAATDIYLKLDGINGEYSPGSTCEAGACVQLYSYQWSATCATCAGVPSQGDFALGLVGSTFDPSSCLSKRVSGDLTFTSTDPLYPSETTVTSVSGRLRDHKGFFLDGIVTAGAFAGYSVSVFVTHPPNPCNPGSFTATVAFDPPDSLG